MAAFRLCRAKRGRVRDTDAGHSFPFSSPQLADVREMLEEQQEVAEVDRVIEQLQANHGSRFSQDEVDELGALIDEGYDPHEAYEYVAPQTDTTREYASTVERFEQSEGRALSEVETDRVWKAVQSGEEEVELLNLDDRHDRREYAASLLSETFERPETPEVVEPLHDDSTAEERAAYITARLEGAETTYRPGDNE